MRFFQSVSLGVFLMGILLVSCTAPEPFDRTFETHMSADGIDITLPGDDQRLVRRGKLAPQLQGGA